MSIGEPVNETVREVLKQIDQLPSPPEICLAVAHKCHDDNSTIGELQELIAGDIALSGRVIQVANSAFFAVRERVASLDRAILLLGYGTVKMLALSFFMDKEFGRLQLPGLPYPDLPRFALATSALAEVIAQEVAPDIAGEASFMGMLHEGGVMAMAMAFKDRYRKMLADALVSDRPLCEAERETFGIDHATCGKLLLSSWRMPPAVVEAVAAHHEDQPLQAHNSQVALRWRILVLASEAAMMFFDETKVHAANQALGRAKQLFNWGGEPLSRVLKRAAPSYHTRASVFMQNAETADTEYAAAMEAVKDLRQQAGGLLRLTAD